MYDTDIFNTDGFTGEYGSHTGDRSGFVDQVQIQLVGFMDWSCPAVRKGIPVFPISAVSGKGVKELLFYVNERLKELDTTPIIFEKEFFPEETQERQEPIVVERVEDGVFSVTGARVERMLGYTNLDSEKGFEFFQRFLKDNGILDKLEELGVEEGDTVVLYDLSFEYYK